MAARSGLNVRRYLIGIFCKPIDSMLCQSIESMGLQKIPNGLDDLKAAIYACPNHTDDGIQSASDHGYLDTCDNPLGPP